MESGGLLAPLYFKVLGYDWIGDDIPRADARWIGSLLGQLSHQQLVDAFRAGQFTPEETKQYVSILEDRIAQLKIPRRMSLRRQADVMNARTPNRVFAKALRIRGRAAEPARRCE